MKIIVISTPVFICPPPGYSGLEQLAWQQAKGLAAKGHTVQLMAPDGSTCSGATVIPIGPAGKIDEQNAYNKYWPLLLKAHCIIDHSWCKFSYILKQEGRLKAPILGVCHAPIHTMFQSLPPVENPCFVCISQNQATIFQGIFNQPARVAYNGIDLQVYKSLNMPRTNRYLFLARFSTIKGPHLAIEACQKSNVGLDLVGDTSITNEPAYLEQCQRSADGRQIKMVGPATRGECVWWFSQAHSLLHPNKTFCEPFGLSPVESQACGNPVIAWNHGAMAETIKHGETGFLVNKLDEMIQLIKDDAVATLNRKRCREWASQFSEERMIDRYEELCQEAVTTGGW